MIRPRAFAFNAETAVTNSFQHHDSGQNISSLALAEFDKMVLTLQASNFHVQIFEDISNNLPDSVFSNNWMCHLPEGIFTIFPMLTPNRRAEVRADVVEWFGINTNIKHLIDLRVYSIDQKFLEGTGSIVFDYRNKIAYACESPRTNISLFEKYCRMIGYDAVSFRSTDLVSSPIYDTNVMLSIADHFAIVCFESIPDLVERKMLEIKLRETVHDIIDISYQQMNQFAANCIEVHNQNNRSHLLMSTTAFASLTEEQKTIIGKHSTILHFDIPVIEKVGGGSVRCMITGGFIS